MTKSWMIWLFILYFGTVENLSDASTQLAGIVTISGYSADTLIKDFFIKGTCRNVSNISSFGNDLSIGRFENGDTSIGFESGIILSTGKIKEAEGPNRSPKTSTSFNNSASDSDLAKFASNVIFDATGIEFDFIPLDNEVTFNYVFASEEYCEFVGSIFNDLFGFFVSGPGIEGTFDNNAINVATVPGTDEYVTINTVNHNTNTLSYVKNELLLDTDRCGIPFNSNYLDLFEFDGFTTPLTATIQVIPCETYHIRLVIGDVGDDKLDSAVFLESKSFNLGDVVTVRAEVAGSMEPIAFESCRDGQFVFERARIADLGAPLDISFTISPLSEAEEGSDFEPIPGMVTIPVGQRSYALPIVLIADGIDEMPERLRLEIDYDCVCLDPVNADLYIADLDTMTSESKEILVCADQEFTVGPEVEGGAMPYTYEWDSGDVTPTITKTVSEPGHYTVIVIDACDDTVVAVVGIDLQSDPKATLMGDTSICFGGSAILKLNLGGYAPWTIEYKNELGEAFKVENILTSPFDLSILKTGFYELIGFEDAFCDGQYEGSAEVSSAAGLFEYDVVTPSCPNGKDGEIMFRIVFGIEPMTLQWDVETADVFHLENLGAGIYVVDVVDGAGCREVIEIEVPVQTKISDDCNRFGIYVPNAMTPNDDGVNDYFELFIREGHSIESIETVRLVDRWGGLYFEANDIAPEEQMILWNGSNGQQLVQPGVYFWQILLKLVNGDAKQVSGTVTVLY